MPYYEYRCLACNTRFDLLRPIAQRNAPATCPQCQEPNSERLISLPMALTLAEDGALRVIGSSHCSSCAATSCAGCRAASAILT